MTAALAWLPVAACSQPAEAPGAPEPAPVSRPPQTSALLTNAWRVTSPGRAPGSLYAFHPDGTLLMTSCVEVYRLARWSAHAAGRITIAEDRSIVYEAEIVDEQPERLTLRLYLRNEQVELTLEPATVPFVCPDLPR